MKNIFMIENVFMPKGQAESPIITNISQFTLHSFHNVVVELGPSRAAASPCTLPAGKARCSAELPRRAVRSPRSASWTMWKRSGEAAQGLVTVEKGEFQGWKDCLKPIHCNLWCPRLVEMLSFSSKFPTHHSFFKGSEVIRLSIFVTSYKGVTRFGLTNSIVHRKPPFTLKSLHYPTDIALLTQCSISHTWKIG